MLPILFQNNDFILYSYPLLMGIGWGIAYQIYFSLISLSRTKAQLLFWGIFLSAWIGAKFFFVLTSSQNSDLLFASNFWMGGGFVFYGGLVGGFIFVTFFKTLIPDLKLENLWPILPALTIGHATGRIGCFLAGCCYGKPTESFFSIHLHGENRYPTQLLEAGGLFIIGFYLLKAKQPRRFLLSVYLISYGLLRFIIEHLRGDIIRGSWGFLTPSQWISLILLMSGLILLFFNKNKDFSESN